ncbi:MAG TPA: prolyl oligopeptidase family serine peptidase [Frankiaceae bacterium]|nr:prolyl oligopeptidase family serine peptidase [Frankiaceae bacterium]
MRIGSARIGSVRIGSARVRSVRSAFLLAAVLAFAACSGGGGAQPKTSTTPVPPGAKASAGCAGPTAPMGRTTTRFAANGRSGSYIQELPPPYTGKTAVPLVFDLHGYAESAGLQASLSGLGTLGATQGFVTLTPQLDGPVPNWVPDVDGPDVAYIGALLDHLEQSLCLDQRRIYVTGYSNGAMLASALMCADADRFAAAAPVAGLRDLTGCRPSRPVPLVTFHGTMDSFVPYDGSPSRSAARLPTPDGSGRTLGGLRNQDIPGAATTRSVLNGGSAMPDILASWATRERCRDGAPAESTIGSDVTHLRYDCPAGSAVELYRVTTGGHAWPGSPGSAALAAAVGRTTFTINADAVMWDFFRAHPLPAA